MIDYETLNEQAKWAEYKLAQVGKEPDEKMQKLCETELITNLQIIKRMYNGR